MTEQIAKAQLAGLDPLAGVIGARSDLRATNPMSSDLRPYNPKIGSSNLPSATT